MKNFNKKILTLGLALLFIGVLSISTKTFAETPPYNEYSIPTPIYKGTHLTASSDGNIWFLTSGSKIAKTTPDGQTTEYDIPLNNVGETAYYGDGFNTMTKGDNGDIWFVGTEYGSSPSEIHPFLNKIDNNGSITSYPIEFPTPVDANPSYSGIPGRAMAVTKGSDGNIWVTGGFPQTDGFSIILKVNTNGNTLDTWEAPSQRGAHSITEGGDGNIWFATYGKISKITSSGVITEYASKTTIMPIVKGPDGDIWFMGATVEDGANIYSVSASGQTTKHYPLNLTEDITPESFGVTFDNSGNILYSTCTYADKVDDVYTKANCGITQIDTSGNLLNYFPFPENTYIGALERAANGSIWAMSGDFNQDFQTLSNQRLLNFYLTDLTPGEQPTPPSTQTPTAPRTGSVAIVVLTISSFMAVFASLVIAKRHLHRTTGSIR